MHKFFAGVSFGVAILLCQAGAQVSGSGTTDRVSKFTSGSQIGDSAITESNGNVGIGTTSPSDRFAIHGTTSGQPGILLFGDYGNYTPAIRLYEWSGSAANYHAWRSMVDNDGAYNVAYALTPNGIGGAEDYAPRLKILRDGNVGIGTLTPETRLTVATPGGSTPFGAMSVDVTTFSSASNASASYFFQVRDIGGGSTPFYIRGDGNTGIGTASPGERLDVVGNIRMNGTGAHLIFPDGQTQSVPWNGTTCGGDYAESVDVAGDRNAYEPGDVLVLAASGTEDVEKSQEPYSSSVAGIYSTKPGLTGRRQSDSPKAGPTEVPMAMVGIVPTKVTAENGPIKRGDLLVTSSKMGYAMKGTDRSRMLGAVVGKAMGSLEQGSGVIEVLVTLQ
ncbi:hypothetical protein [Terriglobus tenax]|uniref:hypothetical protein n=1 Tax=Terriglobus tenax TaxID=1111115 RepID=UPI0021E01397|nr:hypothetical protein [Terriglobus tenax]